MPSITVHTISELTPVAEKLAVQLEHTPVMCFSGDLGSGKTTLIRLICEHLGVTDQVHSPSFSLVNEYESPRGRVCHFDLYRLKSIAEALDIGLTEYLDSGDICLIEWPELAMDFLPSACTKVEIIQIDRNLRRISW